MEIQHFLGQIVPILSDNFEDTGAVGQTRTGLKQASREEDSPGFSP